MMIVPCMAQRISVQWCCRRDAGLVIVNLQADPSDEKTVSCSSVRVSPADWSESALCRQLLVTASQLFASTAWSMMSEPHQILNFVARHDGRSMFDCCPAQPNCGRSWDCWLLACKEVTGDSVRLAPNNVPTKEAKLVQRAILPCRQSSGELAGA